MISQDAEGISREGLRDRILLLRSLSTFAGLDDEALTLVAEHGKTRRYRKGDEVATEGAPLLSVHIVLRGALEVVQNGRTVLVEEEQGIGVLAVLARETSCSRAVAARDTLTLEIPVTVYLNALEENFSLVRHLLRVMSKAMLEARGNLPAKPSDTVPDKGEYFEGTRTLVQTVIGMTAIAGPLANANMDALIEVARRTRQIEVEIGHVFWRPGDPSTYSIRVTHGLVRCTNPEGAHVDVGPGFSLGSFDMWSGLPRVYAAEAITVIQAYRIDTEDFLPVLEVHVDLAMELLSVLAVALLRA